VRQSEELFRLLVDGVKDYAIFMLDPRGIVSSWNTGAQKIKGYTASEIVGKHFSLFYTPEDLARNWPERELEIARKHGRLEDEGWRVRKDGTRFWANVIITALYDSERHLIGFAKVTRDLTARRKMEAMQETERQMNEFLAMLGHELRNPLAAIVNALAIMRAGTAQDGAEASAVMDRQVTHLVRIVDDLLDVSRITRGKIALKNEVFDLNELVAGLVETQKPFTNARGHRVELKLAGVSLAVHADSTRVSQVLMNLLGNAIKYTPDGGRISIAIESEPFEALVRVRDNGIGIPADLLPRVFDLFVQGETSPARTEGGLGIGLTLVKRLAEMQGGSVEASSEGTGKGSEFILRLPRALARDIADGDDVPETEATASGRRRLLVVDDNRDAANTLAALLEVMGHEARAIHEGAEAISVALDFRPDAVFLDIGLPGMNGYEVARKLRGLPELAGVCLIAFTGYGQDDDRRRVREAGFDHHLVKPARAADLARLIDALPAHN
jgi:PAS domain S-box-containing protein